MDEPNAACRQCGAWKDTTSPLIRGIGPKPADIVLIGSGNGREEEDRSQPWVGDAGEILQTALVEAGFLRSELGLTNIVRCRTLYPTSNKNRKPSQHEIDCCRQWTDYEMLEQYKPQLIVALGGEAAREVAGLTGSILAQRGRIMRSERYNCWVIPTVHPAWILRKPTDRIWLVFDLIKARRLIREGGFQPAPVNYTVVDTLKKLEAMRQEILAADEVAFDWETTGLHWTKDYGFCVSFSTRPGTAWVVPRLQQDLADFWGDRLLIVDDVLREIFLSPVSKIAHNGPFDCNQTFNTLGVWPVAYDFDTMMGHHLANNHLGQAAHGLKVMADLYTDMGLYDIELEQWLKKHGHTDDRGHACNYFKAPNEMLWHYAGADADATIRLKPIVKRLIEEKDLWSVFVEERMPLARAMMEIEREGIRINQPHLALLSAELGEAKLKLEKELEELVGHPVNPNSPKQVQSLLFTELALPVLARNDDGITPSTKAEFLKPLEELHPSVSLILQHRAYTKIKGTYVDGKDGDGGIKLAIDDEDGRARTNTILVGTETMRLSTQKPFPIHTWPRNRKGYPSVRALVIAEDGSLIVEADYKQQEYLIMAIAAQQLDMLEAMFIREEDAHEFTMGWMFLKEKLRDYFYPAGFEAPSELIATGVKQSDGLWERYKGAADDFKNQRALTKNVNFGIMYREGYRKLAQQLGLPKRYQAEHPGSSDDEARDWAEATAAEYITKWYANNDKVREYQDRIIYNLHIGGYVTGLFQTRRYLPGVFFSNKYIQWEAERAACNFPIQNGGAHMMLRAKIRIHERLKRLGMFPEVARVYFSVHDAILLHARRDVLPEVMAIQREEMCRPVPEFGEYKGQGLYCHIDQSIHECWSGPQVRLRTAV